jgi:hypothetical protein
MKMLQQHEAEYYAHLQRSRDAWKLAAKRLYAVMGEGGRRGRPMDLVAAREWKWIQAALDAAEAEDECERPASPVPTAQ